MLLGQTFAATLQIQYPAGVLIDADALPSLKVFKSGVETSLVVSISNISTGVYSYTFDVPDTWVGGDSVDIHISASVNTMPMNIVKQHLIEDLGLSEADIANIAEKQVEILANTVMTCL